MAKNAYAEAITKAMGEEVTLRDLERAMTFSYEHIRSIVKGEGTSFSAGFNREICEYLGLDEEKMWDLAQTIQVEKKYGNKVRTMLPGDSRLKKAWEDLTVAQREQVIKIATGMAEQNKVLAALAS